MSWFRPAPAPLRTSVAERARVHRVEHSEPLETSSESSLPTTPANATPLLSSSASHAAVSGTLTLFPRPQTAPPSSSLGDREGFPSETDGRQPLTNAALAPQRGSDTPATTAVSKSVNPSSLRRPKMILVIGAPHTGKSAFINAFRHCVAPSTSFELSPVGLVGRSGTTSVGYYFDSGTADSRRIPAWCLIDTPGRAYAGVDNVDSDAHRVLSALLAGVPAGTPLGACTGMDIGGMSQSCPDSVTRPCLHPDHIVLTMKATDLLVERTTWAGLRTHHDPAPTAHAALDVIADLLEWIHHKKGLAAPHLVLTHMDMFRDPAAAEAAARAIVLCCPQTHQHYVSLGTATGSKHNPEMHHPAHYSSLTLRATERASFVPRASLWHIGMSNGGSPLPPFSNRRGLPPGGPYARQTHHLSDETIAALLRLRECLVADINASRRRLQQIPALAFDSQSDV